MSEQVCRVIVPVPTFMKWAGGKTQLLEQFSDLFPQEEIGTYFEPFLGSGAVFFYLKKTRGMKGAVLTDVNDDIIATFTSVRDKPQDLIELLKFYKSKHGKTFYYTIRNKTKIPVSSPVARSARFIYLNKTCFNGLYRVNSKGEFNVPIGGYTNPRIVDEKSILEANRLLKGAVVKKADFTKVLESAKKGDFVYFDPPYFPISATAKFTNYTKDSFGEKDQRKLAEIFRALDKKGVKVMLSNSDCEFIRGLYKGFNINTVQARRMINCDSTKRGKISEVVVTNY